MIHQLAFPLLVGLIIVALAFDFLNGLHDAANSIATVVATRLLSPVKAVIFAAVFNFAAYFLSIAFPALDDNFMLRARPGVFAAGEMLDWEAPTGGYLLQACFATGAAAARGALAWHRARG